MTTYQVMMDIFKNGNETDFHNIIQKEGDSDLTNMNTFARWCIEFDKLPMMKMLIETYHFDPSQNNNDIMDDSARIGSSAMTQLLRDYLVDEINEKNINERSLIVSCSAGNFENVKLLLNYGLDPNLKNGQLLKIALESSTYSCKYDPDYIQSNNYRVIKLLIESGCDINCQDGLPLKLAIKHHNYEVTKLLLTSGANVDYINNNNNNDNNINNNTNKLYELLFQHNVDPIAILNLIVNNK